MKKIALGDKNLKDILSLLKKKGIKTINSNSLASMGGGGISLLKNKLTNNLLVNNFGKNFKENGFQLNEYLKNKKIKGLISVADKLDKNIWGNINRNNILAHESGHALHFLKKNNILASGDNLKMLKNERIANRNILNHIKNKLSRRQYQEDLKTPYNFVKRNILNEELNKIRDYPELTFNKKIEIPTFSQVMPLKERLIIDKSINRHLKKKYPFVKQDFDKIHTKLKDILKKKPWEI